MRELGVDSYVRISDVSKATEVMWKLVGKKEKKWMATMRDRGKNGPYDVSAIMVSHMCRCRLTHGTSEQTWR